MAVGGHRFGERLNESGLGQLVRSLGQIAGVKGVRCSPHTFRHTFAIEYLRAGGDPLSLMTLLGHTDLKMTNRYVAFATADVKRKHRQFSPVERMKWPR